MIRHTSTKTLASGPATALKVSVVAAQSDMVHDDYVATPALSFKPAMHEIRSLTPLRSKLAFHHVTQSLVVVAGVRVIDQAYINGTELVK